MAEIDTKKLVKDMLEAAAAPLRRAWPEVRDYAEAEFRKLADTMTTVQKLEQSGQITKKRAKLHLEIQKNAMRTVLLTIEGLGILAVEKAINAALRVVRDTVNSALGWSLL